MQGESLPVFPMPADAIFELIPRNTSLAATVISNDFSLLTIPEAEELLTTKQKIDLVSFEGVIVEKRFLDSFTSMYNPIKNRAFGTPGNLVHQLVLSAPFEEKGLTREQNCQLNPRHLELKLYKERSNCDRDEENNSFRSTNPNETTTDPKIEELYARCRNRPELRPSRVSLYLHNWRELQAPLGLVPGMRVIVRHVKSCGKYFKPTFVTTITPIEYLPRVKFNTCHEFITNNNWGPMCNLSLGTDIPINCLCWGRTITVKINHCTIQHTCDNCHRVLYPKHKFCCSRTKPKAEILFVLGVRDANGISDVICKDFDIFQVVLGMDSLQWRIWKKCVGIVKSFSTVVEKWSELGFDQQQYKWCRIFYNFIGIYNMQQHYLDLKCRKMGKGYLDLNPKWYLLQARPSDITVDQLFEES